MKVSPTAFQWMADMGKMESFTTKSDDFVPKPETLSSHHLRQVQALLLSYLLIGVGAGKCLVVWRIFAQVRPKNFWATFSANIF